MGQRIAHEVNTAALPGGAQQLGRPLGFLRWMRLTRPWAFNQRSLLWLG